MSKRLKGKKIIIVSYTNMNSGLGHQIRISTMLTYLRKEFGNQNVDWINVIPIKGKDKSELINHRKKFHTTNSTNIFLIFKKMQFGGLSWLVNDFRLPLFFFIKMVKLYGFTPNVILWIEMTKSYWLTVVYRKLFKVKTILDMDATIDEIIQSSKVQNWKRNLNYAWYIFKELEALTSVDGLLMVSQRMVDVYSRRYRNLPKNKIVVPNSTNYKNNNWSDEERIKFRVKENVKDNFIIIYAGGAQEWQCIDKMCVFFTKLLQFDRFLSLDPLFWVLIWENEKINHIKINCSKIVDRFLSVYSVKQFEVSKFLISSDVGVIFRENLTTNLVSCPTKAGEYLKSGLPILCTESVGDIPQIVNKFDAGFVVESMDNINYENLIDWFYKVKKNRRKFAMNSIDGGSCFFGIKQLNKIKKLIKNLS